MKGAELDAKNGYPLSHTQVMNAKPKCNEYSLADGQGLYLRVGPNGSKYWIFNYQVPYRKNRSNISLGKYPEVSLAQARIVGTFRILRVS